MNITSPARGRDAIDWKCVNSEEFWKIADRIQDETLEEANSMFAHLATASPDSLRDILTQYRYFTVYYIPDLALLVARMEDGALRSFLADILYDELGCGNPEGAHPRLYDDFLASIGVSCVNLDEAALQSNITLLDEARRRLVDAKHGNEYAIGLRGMGGECVCQVYIAQLYEHLMKNPFIQDNKDNIDWTFWDLHVGSHDIAHSEKTRELIDTEIVAKGGKGLKELGVGYGYSMESWREFWVNIFNLAETALDASQTKRTAVKSTVNVQVCNGAGYADRQPVLMY